MSAVGGVPAGAERGEPGGAHNRGKLVCRRRGEMCNTDGAFKRSHGDRAQSCRSDYSSETRRPAEKRRRLKERRRCRDERHAGDTCEKGCACLNVSHLPCFFLSHDINIASARRAARLAIAARRRQRGVRFCCLVGVRSCVPTFIRRRNAHRADRSCRPKRASCRLSPRNPLQRSRGRLPAHDAPRQLTCGGRLGAEIDGVVMRSAMAPALPANNGLIVKKRKLREI